MFVNTLEEKTTTKSVTLNKYELIALANMAKTLKDKFTKEDKVSVSSKTGEVVVRKFKLSPSKIKSLLRTNFSIFIPPVDSNMKASSKNIELNFWWKEKAVEDFSTLYLDTDTSNQVRDYHQTVKHIYNSPEDLLLATLEAEMSKDSLDLKQPKAAKDVKPKKSSRVKG